MQLGPGLSQTGFYLLDALDSLLLARGLYSSSKSDSEPASGSDWFSKSDQSFRSSGTEDDPTSGSTGGAVVLAAA